jgi:hypothetical protein
MQTTVQVISDLAMRLCVLEILAARAAPAKLDRYGTHTVEMEENSEARVGEFDVAKVE